MTPENLKYICSQLLEVDWLPKFAKGAENLLDKCGSKLETMYILGALYFLEKLCEKAGNMSFGDFPIEIANVEHNGEIFDGYYFQEVWPLWIECVDLDCGPRSIMFVPQLTFASKYHHDFGIFYGDYGKPEKLSLKHAIEIDGYKTHKNEKENDCFRDSLVSYPVLRFKEELHDPLTWFNDIMKKDEDSAQEQIDNEQR